MPKPCSNNSASRAYIPEWHQNFAWESHATGNPTIEILSRGVSGVWVVIGVMSCGITSDFVETYLPCASRERGLDEKKNTPTSAAQ